MTRHFDRFIAVDWSGAKGPNYAGIAVAECRPGDAAPCLVAAPGRTWRRSDFVDWLTAQGAGDERLLVGIDCAFALSAAAQHRLLGADYDAASLWGSIEEACRDDADYFGGAFADHHAHAPLFWRSGKRAADFVEHRRATELACRAAALGIPESPLKLVGAKQVGKGGLAGMRTLAALKQRLGGEFGVWPFEAASTAKIACVELYPRLFLRMAGHGNSKVRTVDDLDRCLLALGSQAYRLEGNDPSVMGGDHPHLASPIEGEGHELGKALPLDGGGLGGGNAGRAPGAAIMQRLTDHDTDALVAAAGLRYIAGDPAVWSPPGLDALAIRAEGWIFGVT